MLLIFEKIWTINCPSSRIRNRLMKVFNGLCVWSCVWILIVSLSVNLNSQNLPCEDIGINNSLNFVTTTLPAQVTPGDDFCVEFRVENFTAINTFQFTFTFDPTLMSFVSFADNQTELGDPILPNTQETDNGIITLLWFNFATTGLTLPDGTLAFTICFRAGLEASECVPIGITDALAPLFPATEVNYQLSEQEKCQDSIIFINGSANSCIEIACTELAITNLAYCNSITNSASLSFSACGGAAPYTVFLLRNSIPILSDAINNDFELLEYTNLPTGIWQVRIVDSNGNDVMQNVIIENIAPVTYDPPIVVDPICANLSNGSITIENMTSGLPGELFDVSFSNGITFQDVTDATVERLFNGDYTVTITDTNGCETEETITLFTPPIELDIDLMAATCFGSGDGSISATATGGTPFPGNEYSYNNLIQPSFETITPFEDNAFNNLTNRYRLRVEDSNGCSIEENIEIPISQEILVDINNIQDILCKNECNGSLTLDVLTPGRYTFLVRDDMNNFVTLGGNDGQSLFYNEELCAGTYTVMIQDTSGCSKDTFFEIMEPAEELLAMPVEGMASCNSNDGEAVVMVSGGSAPYTYVWEDDPSVDDDTLSGVMPGVYNVRISDDLGCEIDTFVEVMSGDELEIEAFILDNLECDGTGQGQLDVNILNSSSTDHTFLWTDQFQMVLGNNQILDFNSPGTYIVNVSSVDNDCEDSDTIVISPTPGLSLEIETVNASCDLAQNGSIDIINITGGVGPYDCIWEDGTISSCNPTSLMAGTYDVTVVDSEGCEKDTFVVLGADEYELSFDILALPPSCPGEIDGSITVDNFVGGEAPYQCVWEDPTIISCNPADLEPGLYNFAIIDANGCSVDTFATILEAASGITYELDIVNPVCGGDPGSITINNLDGANPPIDITWSDAGLSGTFADGLQAGDITISFEDARGCTTDTLITLLNEDTNFELTIDATPPDCAVGLDNGTISFPGFDTNTGTCEWEDPDLNAQNCTLIGLSPGIYNVTLTDGNGCQKDTFIDLTVEERLELELSDIMDVSCFGADDGSAIATITNNPLGADASSIGFFWTNPDDNGNGLSDDATQLASGDNAVYAFDGLCTSDTINFTINEPDAITLDFNSSMIDDVACFGECTGRVELQATGGTINGGSYGYLWEDGFNGDQRDGLCSGTYLITITDDNNCDFVDSIMIGEPELLELGIDSSMLILISCGNDNTGSLTVDPTGGCGGYSYSWTDDVSNQATATDLTVGTYGITVTDACGCTAETSFEFESSVPIIATAINPDEPECEGDEVCIGIEQVSGGTGLNYTYSINFGARIDIDSCIMVGPGTYTLLVFDSAGCSEELSVTVQTPPEFTVDLGDDLVLDLGDTNANVSAEVFGGSPSFDYAWNTPAEFDCANQDCSSINVSPFTFTTVELVVTDSNGCTAFDDLNIDIKTERNVYLPNIFNPDALPPDNKFIPMTGRGVVEVVSFRIFDRWGNLVYEAENIPAPTDAEQGWDGRRGDGGNNRVEQGVYVYTAEVRFVDNVTQMYRGEVTVIR